MKSGRTVLITGASRGIGRTTALLFALKGYNVLINYHRSEEIAVRLQRRLTHRGLPAEVFRADVARRSEVDEMVDFCLCRFGGLDVLVNNAGVGQIKLFTEITQADWDEIMAVNLGGVFNCTQSALRHMLPRKEGKIINVASIWGMVGASCEVPYSAAKAGVIGLTKALAKELGPSQIQVNCVAPGVIQTGMLDGLSPEVLDGIRSTVPLQRLGTTQDVARTILFLTSRGAAYITGQVISPSGGFGI